MKQSISTLICIFLVAFATIVNAQPTTWTDVSSNGVWNDVGNWDNGIPVPGDDVVIDATLIGTPMVPASIVLNSLTITGTGLLDCTPGITLTISTNLVNNGTFNLNGANLIVLGDLTNTTQLIGGTGDIDVTGTFDNTGGTADLSAGTSISGNPPVGGTITNPPVPVPVSPWGIVFGVGLIAGFTVFYTRRKQAVV